ncbi:MAG: RdgB/HAM1 family non-canonical purine NTP pyrophosphatase [Bacteroidota bacterium]
MADKLIVASSNPGKVEEIRAILADVPIEIQSLSEYPNVPEIVEDGKTLEENALIKSRIIFNHMKIPVISDDSGLEVFALGMQPGVISARYAGQNVTYADNNRKLIREMKDLKGDKRKAQFRCVAVFKDKDIEKSFEGVCEGTIIDHEMGVGGFGYDPLFVPKGFDKTFAELPNVVKNRISHRAKAFNQLRHFLLRNFVNNNPRS